MYIKKSALTVAICFIIAGALVLGGFILKSHGGLCKMQDSAKYSYQEIQEQMDSTWYYFNASGAMQTGWLKQGNVWYYFHASGEMATGSVLIGNKTYNFDSSGACLNP